MSMEKNKVRATIEYDVEVPKFWDKEQVELHHNGDTWCASNLINEFKELEEDNYGCLCGLATFEVISIGEDNE